MTLFADLCKFVKMCDQVLSDMKEPESSKLSFVGEERGGKSGAKWIFYS